jgi:hypothetical protein
MFLFTYTDERKQLLFFHYSVSFGKLNMQINSKSHLRNISTIFILYYDSYNEVFFLVFHLLTENNCVLFYSFYLWTVLVKNILQQPLDRFVTNTICKLKH